MLNRFALISLFFLMCCACKTTQQSSRQPIIGIQQAPISTGSFEPFPTSDSINPPTINNGLTSANCYEGEAFNCEIEYQIFLQLNELRSKGIQSSSFFGIFSNNYGPQPALTFHPQASWVAREWSKSQAQKGGLSHAGFTSGARASVYQNKFHQRIQFTAENVAYNGGGGSATAIAQEFMKQWTDSSGHLGNMMGSHDFVAVGVYQGSDGMYYGTQIFGLN